MLSAHSKSWFVPVLYRLVAEGEEGPVALLADSGARSERMHPLAHLNPPSAFIGRNCELGDMDVLLRSVASGGQEADVPGRLHLRADCRRIALTGYAGMGKSALAYEAIRRNWSNFPGGIIGITLRDGKSFNDALIEMLLALPTAISTRNIMAADVNQRLQLIRKTLRSLVKRELPCLLLLDNFEEVNDHTELEAWLQFICSLPQEITVIATSRSNPEHMAVGGSPHCLWYEYPVKEMTNTDLLDLFMELASASGLDQRIQLEHAKQQAVLREICTLLDGYPLGAELIFGTARPIGGQRYTPAAATRSLEEVRDDLRKTPLPGILAVLDVSYNRLTPPARLLLSYLAAFKLPFTHQQIDMLVRPEKLAVAPETLAISDEIAQLVKKVVETEEVASFAALAEQWSVARDELVKAAFMQFDGQVYSIHLQIRHFALARLPLEEQRRIHRVVATYYCNLPSLGADEWFEAYEHLEAATESDDLQEAVRVAIRAAHALEGSSYAREMQVILRRASGYASRLSDITGEAEIQCRLGAILRLMGQYAEAEVCLKSSIALFRQENESERTAWALYELAVLYCEIGEFLQARIHIQDALDLFHKVDSARGNAYANMVLGQISYGQAKYSDAKEQFDFALDGFTHMCDQVGQALILSNQGKMYEALGEYEKALLACEESLGFFRELNRPIDQAWIQAYKSLVYVRQGKLDQAKILCDEALTKFQQLGVQRGQAWITRVMGDLSLQEQDPGLARSYYDQASDLFKSFGDFVDQATVFNALGQVSLIEHQMLKAKEYFERARNIARTYDANYVLGCALCGLGCVAKDLFEFTLAEEYFCDAGDIFFNIYNGEYVRKLVLRELNDLPSPIIIPSLPEEWRESISWQHAASNIFIKYPQEAIPLLANLLDNYERGDVAETILLQFEASTLFSVMPDFHERINMARAQRTLLHMKACIGINRNLKTFLCSFSPEEKVIVSSLFQQLGLMQSLIWGGYDTANQDWFDEATTAMQTSDVTLICLSHSSSHIFDQNYEEIASLIDALESYGDTICILPVRLELCDIPEQMKQWQWIDIFDKQGYVSLLQQIGMRGRQIVNDYYWRHYKEHLRQTLLSEGYIDPSELAYIPLTHVNDIFRQYIQRYSTLDIEQHERFPSLHLRKAGIVRQIGDLLQPIIHNGVDRQLTDDIQTIIDQLDIMLQEFASSIGLSIVKKHCTKHFATFLLETGVLFENMSIPEFLPIFISSEYEITDEIIEHLRQLLFGGNIGLETHVAVLLLPCSQEKVQAAKRRIALRLGNVHACDIAIISHEDIMEIVAAKEPQKALQNCVLSQMNLVAIAPYTVAGPTPPHFFFGRAHELREISDHLTTTSYIIIGGRLIGKTSIINRLHRVRLPEYGFRTLSFDCSTTPTYDALLNAPLRDWEPTPLTQSSTTFRELLQYPPDDKPLVLLLDEVDKIVPIDRENGWKFFNMLRSLINARRIQVVLSGERTLRNAIKDATSPLFNFANLMLLGPLDYRAIEELVTRPMKQLDITLINQKSIVDYIYNFTSGHPNVVQRLCRRLIERLNERSVRCIMLDDVQAITESPHFQEYDFLQVYWQGATCLEKIITLVLLHQTKGAYLRDIRQLLAQHASIHPKAADTKDALDQLVELRSILKHSQCGYEFAVQAFPLVLGNATTVEDLLEVLVEEYKDQENKV